ncbi:hypothetical protein FKM82_022782 [Ascaphus truei]
MSSIRTLRTEYEKKKSVPTFQKNYRALIQARLERERYLRKRSAALIIQAAYRGTKSHQLCHQNKAACLLQSVWRMQRQRKKYEHLNQCVIVVQSNVRKYL